MSQRQLCLAIILTVVPVTLAAEDAADPADMTANALEEEGAPNGRTSIWDKVSINGVLGLISQSERGSGSSDPGDPTGWGMPFQPELSITPTSRDEILVKLGFAGGDGLGAETGFTLAPWGGDLSDDVTNLSGGGRDHLLVARYQRTFELGEERFVRLRGGIIDATDHIDQNEYSNDEYTQFLNEALVNAPNAFLISYEPGAAVEWSHRWFAANAIVMTVADNEVARRHWCSAAQLMATVDLGIGEGHYRLIYGRSEDLHDPMGEELGAHSLVLLSFDQELTPRLGAWIRMGRQDTDVRVGYGDVVSGGLQLQGRLGGRDGTIGTGYARLEGSHQRSDHPERTTVFEVYGRLLLTDWFAVTADVQHMNDAYATGSGSADHSGWIAGVRMTVEF